MKSKSFLVSRRAFARRHPRHYDGHSRARTKYREICREYIASGKNMDGNPIKNVR